MVEYTSLARGERGSFKIMKKQNTRGGRSIRFMSNLPLDVNVQSMTIMATKMPFVGAADGGTPPPNARRDQGYGTVGL
jgi:hypothetical protein